MSERPKHVRDRPNGKTPIAGGAIEVFRPAQVIWCRRAVRAAGSMEAAGSRYPIFLRRNSRVDTARAKLSPGQGGLRRQHRGDPHPKQQHQDPSRRGGL